MSYISDKIAEVRGAGHVVPEGIEELFLAIEEEIGLDSKQKKDGADNEVKQLAPPDDQGSESFGNDHIGGAGDENPLNGERLEA